MAEPRPPALSPDCRDQNHTKCDGVAWDEEADEPTNCQCVHHTSDAVKAQLRAKQEEAHQAVKRFDLNPCSLTARAALPALEKYERGTRVIDLVTATMTAPLDIATTKLTPRLITAYEAMPCHCGAMLQDPTLRCHRHPDVRLRSEEHTSAL